MNLVHDVAFHTHIPGDLFVRPIRDFIEQSGGSAVYGVVHIALAILLSPVLFVAAFGFAIRA
jgi:hypothetical protein